VCACVRAARRKIPSGPSSCKEVRSVRSDQKSEGNTGIQLEVNSLQKGRELKCLGL